MPNRIAKKYVYLSLLIFCFLAVLLPSGGFEGDISVFEKWAKYGYENGIGYVYKSGTDYLPLFHYILYAFSFFQGSSELISQNFHFLKLITLFFHFITGYFVLLIIQRDSEDGYNLFNIIFYLLNISILYNGYLWGQVDDILTCFVLLSCYFAYTQQVLYALIFFVLAISFKLQAIIFAPIIGLMVFPVVYSNRSLGKLSSWILIPAGLAYLIILPFDLTHKIHKIINVVTSSVDRYPFVSLNASNLWELVLSDDLEQVPDSIKFFGISYKHWGLFLFFLLSGIALLPIAKRVILSIFYKNDFKIPLDHYLIICSIISLLFFYVNTQMHERYTHPVFPFIISYSIRRNHFYLGILCSLAYLLNLESVLHFLQLDSYNGFIFNEVFISTIYLSVILFLYFHLFELNPAALFRKIYFKRAQ